MRCKVGGGGEEAVRPTSCTYDVELKIEQKAGSGSWDFNRADRTVQFPNIHRDFFGGTADYPHVPRQYIDKCPSGNVTKSVALLSRTYLMRQ